VSRGYILLGWFHLPAVCIDPMSACVDHNLLSGIASGRTEIALFGVVLVGWMFGPLPPGCTKEAWDS